MEAATGRPRLLVVTSSLPPQREGGMAVFSLAYVRQLRERGWDVRVVTIGVTPHNWRSVRPSFRANDGFEVCEIPEINLYTTASLGYVLGLALPVWLESILGWLGDWTPDTIHLHLPPAIHGVLGWALARTYQAPLVVTCHSVFALRDLGYGGPAMLSLCHTASVVTAVSQAAANEITRGGGAGTPAVRVIRNAVDDPSERAAPPSSSRTIAAVGRFAFPKRWDQLLEAFACVARTDPTCHLALVGDGPDRGRLEELAHDLGLDGRLSMPGWLPQAAVHQLVGQARVVVLASDSEALPLTLLEGCALGRPLVGSDVDGIPEVIEQEGNGLLVPRGDIGAMAEALARLLADGNLCDELGCASRALFESSYHWDTIITQYEEALADSLRPATTQRESGARLPIPAQFLKALPSEVRRVFGARQDLGTMAEEVQSTLLLRQAWISWAGCAAGEAVERLAQLSFPADPSFWLWVAETLAADSMSSAAATEGFWRTVLPLAGACAPSLEVVLALVSRRLLAMGRTRSAVSLATRAALVGPSRATLAGLGEALWVGAERRLRLKRVGSPAQFGSAAAE